jgi:DNA-binding CsgD family transcriptional regulator
MKEYGHTLQELEIMRLLAQGEKEIEAGVGFDLKTVLTEADEMLVE